MMRAMNDCTGVESEDVLSIKWCDGWNIRVKWLEHMTTGEWWVHENVVVKSNRQSPSSWENTNYQLIHFRNRGVMERWILVEEKGRGVLW